KRDQAIEEGIRACNDFIADANLTGKAWEAAKADIQAHQKHNLELLRERNEEHRRAARQTIDLADSAPYSMIDVDEGNALIARLKAIDSRIAAIPRQVEPSVRGEFQATADTMRGAVADYIAWIRRNNAIAEEIDQQGLAIWRPLNQPVNTSDNAGQAGGANAVMAKFLDNKRSKSYMIKLFVTQFGMTSEQAEMIAEFTDRFRKYAKKRKNKGDRRWQTDADIFRQYARILASAGGYNNLLWRTAGDTMNTKVTPKKSLSTWGTEKATQKIHAGYRANTSCRCRYD
ncbi:hypothetical protein, partial [Bifidobacterium bombi]|uniref:hypothetical protein n=1 Tax=Bifidobacterium bombi TaxID=471511 RepID=UPI0005C6BC2B